MKYRFPKALLWGVLLALVSLNGILYVPAGNSQQGHKQILRMGYKVGDIVTLDPHRATAGQDRIVVEAVFNGLLRYEPGNMTTGAIEPDLAKSIPKPTILQDGRQQWTFNLKQGVMCQPYEGNPAYELTSEDVVYSLKRGADPKFSSYSGDYDGMTFEATDKYTVKVTLEKPLSSLLFLGKFAGAGGLIVCKKPLEEKGSEWFKTHPVGTGPFMFEKYIPKNKVVLIGNKNYFRGKPHLELFEFYLMPDLSARELGLQTAELDVISGLNEQSWVEKMRKIPGLLVDLPAANEPMIMHFNMSKPPLNLLKVRQAIAYALDRNQFIAFWGKEMATPVYSVIPPEFCPGGLTKKEVAENGLLYEFDPAKAKQLLTEAGYPNGFTLTVNASTIANYIEPWTLIEQQLKKVGITLLLNPCDHATYHTLIRKDLNPLVLYNGGRENADVFLTHYYHSDSIVATGKKPNINFSHIGAVDADGDGTIDSIDDLIVAARREVDAKRQIKLWKEAQIKLLRYLAAYPINYLKCTLARKDYVDWGYKLKLVQNFPKPNENTRILSK